MAQFICKKFYMCIMNVNMNSSNSTCEKTFSVAVRYSRRIILIEECRFWRHFPDKRHFFFFLIVTRMFFLYNGYVTVLSIKTPNRPMPRAWFRIGFICTFFLLVFIDALCLRLVTNTKVLYFFCLVLSIYFAVSGASALRKVQSNNKWGCKLIKWLQPRRFWRQCWVRMGGKNFR